MFFLYLVISFPFFFLSCSFLLSRLFFIFTCLSRHSTWVSQVGCLSRFTSGLSMSSSITAVTSSDDAWVAQARWPKALQVLDGMRQDGAFGSEDDRFGIRWDALPRRMPDFVGSEFM